MNELQPSQHLVEKQLKSDEFIYGFSFAAINKSGLKMRVPPHLVSRILTKNVRTGKITEEWKIQTETQEGMRIQLLVDQFICK